MIPAQVESLNNSLICVSLTNERKKWIRLSRESDTTLVIRRDYPFLSISLTFIGTIANKLEFPSDCGGFVFGRNFLFSRYKKNLNQRETTQRKRFLVKRHFVDCSTATNSNKAKQFKSLSGKFFLISTLLNNLLPFCEQFVACDEACYIYYLNRYKCQARDWFV